MSQTLQLKILGDAGVFDDKHITASHKHKLLKIKGTERPKWECSVKISGKKCKNETKEEDKDGVIGWMCKEGSSCDQDPNYAICISCAMVEALDIGLRFILEQKS